MDAYAQGMSQQDCSAQAKISSEFARLGIGGSLQAAKNEPTLTISMSLSLLSDIADRLDKADASAGEICDRLSGAGPLAGVGSTLADPAPSGLRAQFAEIIDRIERRIGQIEAKHTRISAAID